MNGIEKKRRENIAKSSYIIDITDYDDNAKLLVGWPGYRTSKDKSGLGYLETQAELARMQGLMLRWMFTGKFITHNPIYLLIMFIFGILVGVFPLAVLLEEILVSGDWTIFVAAIFILPYAAIGIALVINAGISVFTPNAKSITGD